MHSVSQQVSFNTETCGTGWRSGCPSVPYGLRSVPGGSAPPPLARADDRDRDPTSAFLLGPHGAVCWGSAALLPHSGSRLPVQPQVRPSQALVMQCPGRPSSWVLMLAGDPMGRSTTSLVPSCPWRFCTSAVQPACYPRKQACAHVCVPALSVVVRLGRVRPTRGVHLSLPRGRGSQDALVGPGQV